MRFLFSFSEGTGHFLPTVVFARALARRGHDIRYACQDSMVTAVEAAGFCAEPTGGASLLNRAVRRAAFGSILLLPSKTTRRPRRSGCSCL